MLTPQSAMSDIDNINNQSVDAGKEYINKTTYSQQVVDIDAVFTDGSIPITNEIAAQAKIAVERRMIAVAKYTEDRIEKVNKNLKQYYGDESVANSGKSLARVAFPETFNAVEDWADDVYLMFEDLINDLKVEDIGDNVEEFLVKSLAISAVDDPKKTGVLRSMISYLFPGELKEKDNYYFKKSDIIKSFLKRCLHRSKFKENVEKFLNMGIVSGMFVLKDDWGPTGEYKLCRSKDKGDGSKYKYELDQEDVYRFKSIDSRMLIFPKHGMQWVIEKRNTTFHELLNIVLDEDNNPVENPKYDVKMLKKLAEYLRDAGIETANAKDITLEAEEEDGTPDSDLTDLWNIDGNVTVYECHAIPLLVNGAKGKKPYKYFMTMVNLSERDDTPNMFPIGIQKTPYVSGIPFMYCNFVQRDGDIAGIGLPELVRPLQTMLNDFAGHSVDVLNLALWGIMVIDPDVFKDPTKLKEITPRAILKLKNMKGRNVQDVVQWLHPKMDTISAVGDLFALFQQALKRTTRKGPTGDKISPNPSVSEFESIIAELSKSVNKVGLRINNIFSQMLERMYVYNMLNMKSRIKLKPQAYRINNKNKVANVIDDINAGSEGEYTMNEKGIELSPEEIFIDGLNFRLTAADTYNKKAVEKQQALQITKLLYEVGAVLGPDGQPHVIKDETGAPVVISEFKLFSKLLDYFNYDDIFEKIKGQQPEQSLPPNSETPPESQLVPGGGVPTIDQSPAMGDISQQATTLSQGLNV